MSRPNEEPPTKGHELVVLRAKYERMIVLRDLHDRARRDPAFVEPDPRAEMAALAEEFPGALREIDELPLDVLRGRMDALAAATLDPSRIERWMGAQIRFHRLARGALVVKRWLAGTKAVTAEIEARFASALGTLPRGDDARLWQGDLGAIAVPPRGRLMDVVHRRVAFELGVTELEARELVFGPSRRAQRRERDR